MCGAVIIRNENSLESLQKLINWRQRNLYAARYTQMRERDMRDEASVIRTDGEWATRTHPACLIPARGKQ